MIIGLVTPYFPDSKTIDSGIANHYNLLAECLALQGNKIIVIHIRPVYPDEVTGCEVDKRSDAITIVTNKVKSPGILNHFLKQRWAVSDFLAKLKCMYVTATILNKLIVTYAIEVIETTSYFSLCYPFLFKKCKVPIAVRVSTTYSQIMTDHYPYKSRVMDYIAGLELKFIRKSKHLITHADGHALEIERLYHIKAERFKIIPHGVKVPVPFVSTALKGLPVKILYVGRLEYRKGTDVLLAAIPIVIRQRPGIRFELIGHDPGNEYERSFRAKHDKKILEKTFFSGRADEVILNNAYQECDIFVAPSRYESFGIVFIEAMSYGKPVIGCDVGGISEIINNNLNGLFSRAGDADDLADKIILLVDDAALRYQMGLNGRKYVEDKFSGDHLAKNSFQYYREITGDDR